LAKEPLENFNKDVEINFYDFFKNKKININEREVERKTPLLENFKK